MKWVVQNEDRQSFPFSTEFRFPFSVFRGKFTEPSDAMLSMPELNQGYVEIFRSKEDT